ncbi:hypothetical protein D3C78_1650950 [compost metagenome]
MNSLDLGANARQNIGNFTCCLSGIVRKLPYLPRYDGKALAMLASTRRFYRSVQRQQVSLLRNIANRAYDRAYPVILLIKRLHHLNRVGDN